MGGFRKAFGPGVLFAAVSIGTSHLVQSTQAGAGWGLSLVPVILFALVMKYPLYEFGQRYAMATGHTLLEGYRRQGAWTLWLYLLLTLATMFTVLAAVALVTAGLAEEFTGLRIGYLPWAAVLVGLCAGVLAVGRFPLLDKATKVIVLLLAVSTLVAAVFAIPELAGARLFGRVDLTDAKQVAFIVALIGWMPTGVEVCVWQSMWALARARQTGHRPTLRETLADYRIGYLGTGLVALMFVLLGVAVMFLREQKFEDSAVRFSAQLVSLYASLLGNWSRPLIELAAFTTMLSTLLTVLDGFPRALQLLLLRMKGTEETDDDLKRAGSAPEYWLLMALTAAGAFLVLGFLMRSFKSFVNLAMILSFVTGPLLGFLAYRAVTASFVPAEFRPGRALRVWALAGIFFLLAFLAWFAVVEFS
ncbi:MAG: Nramp family divalent metal transporter [Planctomycetes bacterium]|jgi:Mn2+/Fe2+ NRAMP family transporter|nr:Nramp family divalent metal transporter [Planctomycetota bacterium]